MAVIVQTIGLKHFGQHPCRAGGTNHLLPAHRTVASGDFFKRQGGDPLGFEQCPGGDKATRKVTGAEGAAANGDAFGDEGVCALAQDQFGGAAANVQDQTHARRIGNRMGHAGVHQLGFFMPGNHVDTKPQVPLGAGEKQLRIVGFAYCAGGHRTYSARFETPQLFAEPSQGLPAPIQCQFVQRPALQALR
ncbi:hypothetical protein D3C87_1366480 [compost metagenome]